LLEIGAADFGARDVGGDREHRHAAAMAVEQAVDEMQVAGPAAAGTDGEFAREVRLGAGGEGRGLLVAQMHPRDLLLLAQRIGETVQRIADHAVDALDARDIEGFGHQVGDGARHARLRCWYDRATMPRTATVAKAALIPLFAETPEIVASAATLLEPAQ